MDVQVRHRLPSGLTVVDAHVVAEFILSEDAVGFEMAKGAGLYIGWVHAGI